MIRSGVRVRPAAVPGPFLIVFVILASAVLGGVVSAALGDPNVTGEWDASYVSPLGPQTITVPLGSQVTFVNNDSRDHQIASDPHPEHTACPEINQVGYLTAGQSRQTGNLVVARTCGYHDHINFEVKSLQGTITIR